MLAQIKPAIPSIVRRTVVGIAPGVVEYVNTAAELTSWDGPAIDDITAQMQFLLPRNAITIHGMEHLQHLPRYMAAVQIRLEEMNRDPDRDVDRQSVVDEVKGALNAKLARLPKGREKARAVKDIMWRIEELRVSLFAQRLGTAKPVSQRRIEKMIEKLA